MIDLKKINSFLKLQPYSPYRSAVKSAGITPQVLLRYYELESCDQMSVKTAQQVNKLVELYESENEPLDSSDKLLDVEEFDKLLHSGIITGYEIRKTGIMNATNGNLYVKGHRSTESMRHAFQQYILLLNRLLPLNMPQTCRFARDRKGSRHSD